MKKLLSILASVGMTATASTAVVACTTKEDVKLSIDTTATDLGADFDNAVRKGYDYVKTVNKYANKIIDQDKVATPAENTDGSYTLVAADEKLAGDVLVGVYKYGDFYQLASINDKISDIVKAKKGTVEISFITISKMVSMLNSKDGKAALGNNAKDFKNIDFVKAFYPKADKRWEGGYTDLLNTVQSELIDGANTKGSALVKSMYKKGNHKVQVKITIEQPKANNQK